MTPDKAGEILSTYLEPVYGFALKRCKSREDAEDLSQEIMLRAYRALTTRGDIGDPARFVWTIAHNLLCNYYRDSAKYSVGLPLDEVSEPEDEEVGFDDETLSRLRQEISYLSRLRREIVIAYYFERRSQNEISRELGIPVGTVKWHLFGARNELKRGMDMTRDSSELRFNPIKFHSFSINGSIGTRPPEDYLRGAIEQNICYCVRDTARTVGEIADSLGVSPVYVENELEYLVEYGFIVVENGIYIANFIIDEPTSEQLELQNNMYKQGARLIAPELWRELNESGLLDSPELKRYDRNYLLWSLIPYIAAQNTSDRSSKRDSGDFAAQNASDRGAGGERNITFDEVAVTRPDGARNIYKAAVASRGLNIPAEYEHIRVFGPMWNGYNGYVLWRLDSEWCDRSRPDANYPDEAKRVLSLWQRSEPLSTDECACLAERGYIRAKSGADGNKPEWTVVTVTDNELHKSLLDVGGRVKTRHEGELADLKRPYADAVTKSLPKQLVRTREYELQFVFGSDGWFLLHCILTLLDAGLLTPPDERGGLSTLIVPNY